MLRVDGVVSCRRDVALSMHLREVRDADIGEDFHENTTALSPRYRYQGVPSCTADHLHLEDTSCSYDACLVSDFCKRVAPRMLIMVWKNDLTLLMTSLPHRHQHQRQDECVFGQMSGSVSALLDKARYSTISITHEKT